MPSGESLNHQAWAEAQAGVVAGEGGKLARVAGLIEREEDEGEAGLIAVAAEQRAQGAGVLSGGGNVSTLIAAEAFKELRVMIANAAGVQLHDEAVFDAHAGHLGEHLRLEELGVAGLSGLAVDEASVEAGCICC